MLAFHHQTFLSWRLIYEHNFSPHRYFIWNTKTFCSVYRKDITTLPRVILNCNPFMGNIVRNKTWHLPNKYLITNKEKEISFKPIHRFYLCKDYLKPRIKSEVEEKCCFYKQCPETVVHLLWYCKILAEYKEFYL